MRIFKSIAACLLFAAFTSNALATSVFSALGGNYTPKSTDIFVQGNAGGCCVGDSNSITNVYMEQTFKATSTTPNALTLGLVNNGVSSVPFQFRLLITELNGQLPTSVLWESSTQSVFSTNWQDVIIPISELNLISGKSYAWVLNTFVTRDGNSDVGGVLLNLNPYEYSDGTLYFNNATGQGREVDFASGWTNSGMDAAFLMTYSPTSPVPEPSTLALMLGGLCTIGIVARRRQKVALI